MERYSNSSYRRSKRAHGRFLLLMMVMVVVCIFSPALALAAEAAATAATTSPPEVSPWLALIPVVVPVAIAAMKVWLKNMPKTLIPILAPIIGCLASLALYYGGLSTLSPFLGAALGSAGVGLREIGDQLTKAINNTVPGYPG